MFVIAGNKSGSGKTTITLGIMEALKRRGLSVRPFKAGPDYIDPGLHASLCEKPSYNLDTWMMGTEGVKNSFKAAMSGNDMGVVEGVMGLYDGKGGIGEEGSTAHLAKTLNLPVILVVDASSMARSIAALIKGFTEFDPALKFLGVIVNRVASERHAEIVRDAVSTLKSVKLLGMIPRETGLKLGERHLGLVTRGDILDKKWSAFIKNAGDLVEEHIDLDLIIKKTRKKTKANGRAVVKRPTSSIRIGLARDPAFSFYYEENLDILKSYGAELVEFSPINDIALPPALSGLYIGGGYPELYAEELNANKAMRAEIKAFSRAGRPVFAECGGLIYLGRKVRSTGGLSHEMAGVFPWTVRMLKKRKALGYRELTACDGTPFLEKGERVRGHEFHYSELCGNYPKVTRAFGGEAFLKNKTIVTYTHLCFASNPGFAGGFIDECKKIL